MKIKIGRWNFVLFSKPPGRAAHHGRENLIVSEEFPIHLSVRSQRITPTFLNKTWDFFPASLIMFLHIFFLWKIF